MAPLSISITRSAESSCRHSTRRAEQRWPALSNAEDTVDHHLLGQAEESTIGVLAAGFGDQRDRAALVVQAAGDVALQQAGLRWNR
jgi:hypothetical protein